MSTDYKRGGRGLNPRRKPDRLAGGRGGKPERRSRSGTRVVDPGLFYALRAAVRLLLWLAEGSPGKREPTAELMKLRTWYDAASQVTRSPDAGAYRRQVAALALDAASGDERRQLGKGRACQHRDDHPLEAPPEAAQDGVDAEVQVTSLRGKVLHGE